MTEEMTGQKKYCTVVNDKWGKRCLKKNKRE